MCARYSLVPDDADFSDFFDGAVTPAPRVNIAPTDDALVKTASGIAPYRWGFVPSWADDLKVGVKMINARSETVTDKPAFRAAFRHRRCLVPASSFFEWRHTTQTDRVADDSRREGQGSLFGENADAMTAAVVKHPFLIRDPEHQPLMFAGLWEEWRGSEAPLRTFTILTTTPNAELETLHNRMPVILDPHDWDMWLDPDFARTDILRSLLQPRPDGSLTMYPVTTRVGNPRYQDPDAIRPCSTAVS